MQLYSVNTGYFKLDGGAMFGVVPKVIWNKLNPADENNLCSWALRSLLIEDGNRLILVDNGMGDKQDAKFFGHYHMHGNDTLDGSLARHGFHRNDITDVILTHLHFDHCGGSIVRQGASLVPAFPNATYWSNTRHWEWATKPNDREKASFLRENILPIEESGQLRMIDIPETGHAPFTDNIQIRFVHGHTDGQMLPQIRYKGKTVVFMADLLPSVHHIPVPYVMAYDMFPLTSLHEKKAFVEEALAGEYILFFQHDPVNECCILQQTDRGIRQQECFTLDTVR
jgi:glyoxylase-like metal-dependent hydrolase (beta-lactamase superfamily II)